MVTRAGPLVYANYKMLPAHYNRQRWYASMITLLYHYYLSSFLSNKATAKYKQQIQAKLYMASSAAK